MSKPFFIFNFSVSILILFFSVFNVPLSEGAENKSITITSETLTADNKNSTALFEGSVIARTRNISSHSDKMTVYYNESGNNVKQILASGNVKVHSDKRAIFSKEASYFNDEEKIVFTGNAKAVEGGNVITGSKIIYFLKDDRAVIEGSRVILQNNKALK